MKKIILFFLLLIFISSSSQVSGYMGKRCSIGYSNYFMFSALGPTANDKNSGANLGVNSMNCLNLEYTIKNKTNFCLSLQMGKTGMEPGDIYINESPPNTTDTYPYVYIYSGTPYKPMQVNSTNISAGFKFFYNGTLAPVGKYQKVELLMLFNHLTYNKYLFETSNTFKTPGYSLGTGDYQFKTFGIAYTQGRSRVFFDKLVFDFGLRFCLTPLALVTYFMRDNNYYTNSANGLSIEKRLKYDVDNRIFRSQLFNIHIGLSFLAF